MSASWNDITDAPLHAEHLLLGAAFDDLDALLAAPRHYGDPTSERATFTEGCALCDLSGMTAVLIAGEGAPAFVSAACTQRPLAVGECAFGAVLSGDGSLSAVPLVARTGDAEYLIWDVSERGLMLQPWLRFLAGIEQDGYRPFGSVRVEDASNALVPLLLWGPQARAVLADYVPSADLLPASGHVANVQLDRIPCLVAAPPHDGDACLLVLVPPAAARVLWRSFLSFTVVNPVGTHPLARHATTHLPWLDHVLGEERLELPLAQLRAWRLARPEGGYVGERALRG